MSRPEWSREKQRIACVRNAMLRRCYDPRSPKYPSYGGRGITVCSRWLNPVTGLAAFREDMGPRPSRRHMLDRIDNQGNYEPENCRWATPVQQQRNRRDNVAVTVTMTPPEWAEVFGIPAKVIARRVADGWDHRRAVSEPVGPTSRRRRK